MLGLVDHHECIVAKMAAHLDAFPAALAVDGIDEDPEHRRLESALCGNRRVLLRLDEVAL